MDINESNDIADINNNARHNPVLRDSPFSGWDLGDDSLTKRELDTIRANINATIRPSYHRPPPANFGEAAAGKLKAEEWKSIIEWDLPVSLAQMWLLDSDTTSSDERRQRRRKLAQSTILLATAIRWATSYRTSQEHADQFMSCMQAYLNSLKGLYPRMRFRPNHHAALHIGPFLPRFGPMPGWWMFPFERIIGILQKIKTNYKLGKFIAVIRMPPSLISTHRRNGNDHVKFVLRGIKFQVSLTANRQPCLC